jgi:hypothetical protein
MFSKHSQKRRNTSLKNTRNNKKRRMNQYKSHDLSPLSHNSLSVVFSFLDGNEIIKVSKICEELSEIIRKYNLINIAFKYKLEQTFPRIGEVKSYYNEKVIWKDLYNKKNNLNFNKQILEQMLNYQCDMIMEKKPLVMSIYNACFDICVKRGENSDFCYLLVIKILKQQVIQIQQKLNNSGFNLMNDYKQEKKKYIKIALWMSKTMMYLERFFIPNTDNISINSLARVLFHAYVINIFPEINDEIVIENETINNENLNIAALINQFT